MLREEIYMFKFKIIKTIIILLSISLLTKFGYSLSFRDFLSTLTGKWDTNITEISSYLQEQPNPEISAEKKNNIIFLNNLDVYIKDIKAQTGRTIPDVQYKKILDFAKFNTIKKLDKEVMNKKRASFDKVRSNLLKEWEQHYEQSWPKYTENVVLNGKIVRQKGNNYDAHHIIELSYNGPNEYWNLTPARYPDEHQNGIHRKDGICNKIFPLWVN